MIKNWKSFNEGQNNEINKLTESIFNKIIDKLGRHELTDLHIGNSLTPYAYFIYNNKPFSISLVDISYKPYFGCNISIIVEDDGTSDSLGIFKMSEIDRVVSVIKGY